MEKGLQVMKNFTLLQNEKDQKYPQVEVWNLSFNMFKAE